MDQLERLFSVKPTVLPEQTAAFFAGKRVLVTGGGGFIGSELCRRLAEAGAAALCIFEIAENTSCELALELDLRYPRLPVRIAIGSVRDKLRLQQVFAEFAPQIVCHAAAHKHVPLLEDAPGEAVKNNILGTQNTAEAAVAAGAEQFLLISTDKAVQPKSVMGMSKRVCELLAAAFDKTGKTRFTTVRFGNVFGSSGSVVPLISRQIALGGPVTVTHKDATRYFMTVNEAVNLALIALSVSVGGETFVLEMGEPVSIKALAEELLRRSGKSIPIQYTGLRPGEKLHEELTLTSKTLQPTGISRILREVGEEQLPAALWEELKILYHTPSGEIKEALQKLLSL